MRNNLDLEEMVKILEDSKSYRVLRKLEAPQFIEHKCDPDEKIAAFVDVETTGLDPIRDEVIEIAIVRFCYTTSGRISGLIDTFDQLREPSFSIPDMASAITGITNEMVSGCQIDKEAITHLINGSDLVIAHNAAFDRRFLERLFSVFATKPWACSMSEINWLSEGYEGTKLSYLASEAGFFYDRHRAENDCLAAIELLKRILPSREDTGLSVMLRNARKTSWRIWAEGAPFECKEVLKGRGYRWNNGGNRPRSWYIDVDEEEKAQELEFLKNEIYRGNNQPVLSKVTAFERYSDRV